MHRTWKRWLAAIAITIAAGAIAFTTIASLTVWLMVRDEIAQLRAIAATAPKPKPEVSATLRARQFPGFFEYRPQLPSPIAVWRSLRPNRIGCGDASVASVLARRFVPREKTLWRETETFAVAYVAARVMTPDELMTVYALESRREKTLPKV